MIRTKQEIDLEIKQKREFLEIAIEESVDAEKRSDEHISSIKNKLSELSSETCFEDTLEGESKALEQEAFEGIDIIIKNLSEKTGRVYNSEVKRAPSKVLVYPNIQYDADKTAAQFAKDMRGL